MYSDYMIQMNEFIHDVMYWFASNNDFERNRK